MSRRRASYLAGYEGTTSVLAGRLFGIPLYSTMAHSFVQAHESEDLAFEHFARAHPENTTLLINTYDTEAGAAKVVKLARRLAKEDIPIRVVRIDNSLEHACGDIVSLEGDACEGKPLLIPVMCAGQRVSPPVSLDSSRQHCRQEVLRLPTALQATQETAPYPVQISASLHALAEQADRDAQSAH